MFFQNHVAQFLKNLFPKTKTKNLQFSKIVYREFLKILRYRVSEIQSSECITEKML